MSLVLVRSPKGAAPPPKTPPVLIDFLRTDAASNATAQFLTASIPAGSAAGDLLIASCVWRRTTPPGATTPSGWTLLQAVNVSGTISHAIYYKFKTNESSFGLQLSSSASGTSAVIEIFAFRGVNAAAPITTFQKFTATASTTTIPIPAITTPDISKHSIAAVCSYLQSATGRTVTWQAGFSEMSDGAVGNSTATYLNTSAAGVYLTTGSTLPATTATVSATVANRTGYVIAVAPA